MVDDGMVAEINVPLAVERAKRMKFKPHAQECLCDECENFLTGWDMGFAHAYTYAAAQVGPYKTALSDLVDLIDGSERIGLVGISISHVKLDKALAAAKAVLTNGGEGKDA